MTLSNHDNLGNLLGELGWNKGIARSLLFVWLFLFLPFLLLLLFSFILIGPFGFILLGYYIYQLYQAGTRLLTTKPVLLVYEQGLIDGRKRSIQVIHYADIKNIYIAVVMSQYQLTLETQNKKKIKIDENIANVDHLRIILEEQILRQKLPDVIALYQQGNSVVFDNLQVSQTGLMAGKRILPWSEFGTADIQRSGKFVFLIIYQKDGKQEWAAVRRNSLPNIALFLALVNYAKGTQIA